MSHDPKDPALISRMGADAEMNQLTRKWFDKAFEHRYSYNFQWMGRPIIQFPQDMVAFQELVWNIRPKAIVETGIAHGGSLILSASLLELLGEDGLFDAWSVPFIFLQIYRFSAALILSAASAFYGRPG